MTTIILLGLVVGLVQLIIAAGLYKKVGLVSATCLGVAAALGLGAVLISLYLISMKIDHTIMLLR